MSKYISISAVELGFIHHFGRLYSLGICHVLNEMSMQDIMRTLNDDNDYDNNATIIGNDDVKLAMHLM